MLFGKAQAQMTQIVSSLQVPDSCYGQCVPYVFGRARIPQKLIYWGNLQNQTAGGKKGGKSGQVTYTVNADMLFGYGPFEGVASIWQNQTWWFVNYSSQTFTGSGTHSSFTFSVSNNTSSFVMVMGVQVATTYSMTYNDYGGYGITRTFTLAGTSHLPLYNNAFPAPNYGTWSNMAQPYATYNAGYGDDSVIVTFPSAVTAPVVTVYYAEVGGEDQPPQSGGGKKGGGGNPIQQPGLTFERELGVGPSGNPQSFLEFSGTGGANIPLGYSPELPFLNFEVKALFGLGNASPASVFDSDTGGYTAVTASGDCNPADIILDIITSGNRADAIGSSPWNPAGSVFQATISNTSAGYQVGDILAIVQSGGSGATLYVTGITNFGIPTEVIVKSEGSGYHTASNVATSGGHGSGLTVNISATGSSGAAAMIWQHGLNFTAAVSSDNPEYCYSRYGGILADESTLWSGGTNPGLNAIRNYCMAYNIFISGAIDAQLSGADLLNDLCRVANCAAVWDGAALNFIPYCEVSAYGNGTSYVAPTASGPVFALNSNHFQPLADKSPVEWNRDRPSPNFNSLQIGFRDATQQFNSNYVIIADTMDIAVQGPMPGSQENHDYITNPATAQNVGWALLRRNLTVDREEGKFKLPAYFETIFTPMDLVTLYDLALGTTPKPARIKTIEISMDEQGKRQMELTAEPYIYGASVPIAPPSTGTPGSGTNPGPGNPVPGSVNPPIFIETVPGLNPSGPQLWICVCGSGVNYGGCAIWMSVDGGASYGASPVGIVVGRQTMGVLTATYPTGVSPDTTDTLSISLAESLGAITAVSSTAQSAYASLSVLTDDGRFSYLNDGLVFKMNLPEAWIGLPLAFKFTAFNITGGQQQELASATPYTFTPTGLVGWTYNASGTGGVVPTGNQNSGDIYIFMPGTYPTGGAVLATDPITRITILPENLPASVANCLTAPTGAVSMPIVHVVGGTPTTVGSINFAAGAKTGTFTFAATVTFNPGDSLQILAPSTPDGTFSGVAVTLWGTATT